MMLRSRVGMARHAPTVVLMLLLLMIPAATYAGTGPLVVAVATGGDLYWWHQTKWDGEMIQVYEGNALQPFIAPDGNRVAFTAGDEGLPQSLWVVADNDEARQMVTPEQIGGALVDQVEWLDATMVYFNTSTLSEFGAVPQDDLWRVDTVTEALTNVLPAGEGGAFSIFLNTTGERLFVIVSAGSFDEAGEPETDGSIRIIDRSAQEIRTLLTFPSVQTFSHNRFYPQVHWGYDNEAQAPEAYVAIPDALFDPVDNIVDVVLWRIPGSGEAVQFETLQVENGLRLGFSPDALYTYRIVDSMNGREVIVNPTGDYNSDSQWVLEIQNKEFFWNGDLTTVDTQGFDIYVSPDRLIGDDPGIEFELAGESDLETDETLVHIATPFYRVVVYATLSESDYIIRWNTFGNTTLREEIGRIPVQPSQSGFTMSAVTVPLD